MSNPSAPVASGAGAQTDLLQRALTAEREGHWRDAQRRYQRALQAQPDNLEALVLLGDLERRRGSPASAVDLLQHAAQLAPTRADILENLGRALAANGQADAARDTFTRALAANPDYAQTYVSLGDVWRRKGFVDEAQRHYQQARQCDPTQAGAHLGLGLVLARQGHLERACQALRDALALDPSAYAARETLARLLNKRRDFARARELFEQCLVQQPGSVRVNTGLAWACLQLGRLDAAREAIERALRAEPRSVTALALRGHWHLARSQCPAARKYFARALARAPRFRLARLGRVAVLAREHDFDAALAAFDAIELADNDDPDVCLLHAEILSGAGNCNAARLLLTNWLHNHVARHPWMAGDRFAVHRALGAAHEQAGDYASALEQFANANACCESLFDRAEIERRAADMQKFFAPGARWPRATATCAAPVLVVGLPSTGKTMVQNIFRAHSAVIDAPAIESVQALADGLAGRFGSPQSFPQCLRDCRGAELAALAREVWPGAFRDAHAAVQVLGGSVDDDVYLGFYAVLFPNLRVVHCARDPQDLEIACFRHDYAGAVCDFALSFASIAARAALHEQLMAAWRGAGTLTVLGCQRERLIDRPLQSVKRLLAFAGLDYEPACLAAVNPGNHAPAGMFHTPLADPGIGRGKRYAIVRNKMN